MEKIKVVIVEDDKEMREGLELIVQSHPSLECVATCSSGEVALETIPGAIPDIVLMDIHLPGISGIECIRQLKPTLPLTQFMMCTVYEDSDNVFDSLCAGAAGYLLKNSPPSKITDSIVDLYQGGSPMSPTIARKVLGKMQEVSAVIRQEPGSDYKLSSREKEVLACIVNGLSHKMIAGELNISYETVRSHVKKIYEKLHVVSISQVVFKAVNEKLL